MEQAKICLSDITDFVLEMLVSLPHDNPDFIVVKESGDTVLELCAKSENLLGKADIRKLGQGGFEFCLSGFIKKVNSFDKDKNGDKLAFHRKGAEKKIALLLSVLDMPWNSDCRPADQDKDEDNREDTREDTSTPPPAVVKPVLKRMTPHKGKPEYPCGDCPIVFTSVTSYRRHIKDKHDKMDSQTKAAKVTCMLQRGDKRCKSQKTLADFYRHLRMCHNEIEVPDKSSKKTLRFFKSLDGGKTFTDIIFMQSGEPDPSTEDVSYYEEEPAGAQGNNNDDEEHAAGAQGNDEEELAAADAAINVDEPANRNYIEEPGGVLGNVNEEEIDVDNDDEDNDVESNGSESLHEIEVIVQREEGDRHDQVDLLNIGSEIEVTEEGSNNNDLHEVLHQAGKEMAIQVDLSDDEELSNNNNDEPMLVDPVGHEESDSSSLNNNSQKISPEKEKPKKVTTVYVEAGEDVFFDLNNLQEFEDSLLHSSDEEEFTEERLANKKRRYEERNQDSVAAEKLWEAEGNAEFISKMDDYMKTVKYSTNANRNKLSHVSTTHRLLFTDPDSWLVHMARKKPNFKLGNMLLFSSDNLEQITNPIPWINEIGGESGTDQPTERKERLKSFARLRSFISYMIANHDFDLVTENGKADTLQKHLTDNAELIKREKLWTRLDTLIAAEARDKKLALQIQDPTNDKNTVHAVRNWFQSDKHKELLDKHNGNWEQGVANEKISEADFTDFALFCRFITMLLDRNRSANYKFTNEHFICALKIWYPADYAPESFQPIPDDWNIHEAPADGRKHDALQIKLSGKQGGLKGQIGTTITIHGLALTLCTKYRDLKKIVHPQVEPDAPFFVNYQGELLAELSNTRGSLLDVFGKAVGMLQPTVTKIRKALDTVVLNSQVSRKRVLTNAIVNHGEEVSAAHYDLEGADARSNFMYALSQAEGGNNEDDEEVTEEVESKRAKLDEEDRVVRENFVRKTLQKNKKPKLVLGKNQKIHTEDRVFLQRIFSMKEYQGFHSIRLLKPFPGLKQWSKIFYRVVDSNDLSEDDQQKLREVERRIFDQLKPEIVKACEEESWVGSLSQNKRADYIIATKIRTSFRVYEKSGDAHDVYFTFN